MSALRECHEAQKAPRTLVFKSWTSLVDVQIGHGVSFVMSEGILVKLQDCAFALTEESLKLPRTTLD